MSWLKSFGRFWYDFIVGDDWTIALGVVVAVALTALAAHAGLAAWAILPVTVTAGLTWSVARARPRPSSASTSRRPERRIPPPTGCVEAGLGHRGPRAPSAARRISRAPATA